MSKLEDIHSVYSKTLYIEDFHLIDVPLAQYISRKIPGDPVWLTGVATSGYGKTTMVNPLIELAYDINQPSGKDNDPKYDLFYISQVTPASFASGSKGSEKQNDIGHWLDKRDSMIIISDLASIQTMDSESKEKLQGLFRELFDGKIKIDTGTANKFYKNIHCSMLSFCTPQVAQMIDKNDILGTRGINYNIPTMKCREKALGVKDTKKGRAERTAVVKDFVDKHMDVELIKLSDVDDLFVKHLALDIAKWRTQGVCDDHSELIQFVLQEYPMRVRNQLEKLYRGLLTIGVDNVTARSHLAQISSTTGNVVRREIMKILVLPKSPRELSDEMVISPYEIKKQLWILSHMKLVKALLKNEDDVDVNITDLGCRWCSMIGNMEL